MSAMYEIEFSKEAAKHVLLLRKSSPQLFKKLERLLDELKEHPYTGTGFRFYPVYQPQFRDEELEVKELQAKVTARHQIDNHVYEYLRYSCGFTSEEINRNKETLITAQEKIADLIGELAILNGKSREKNNPKGWIINSLKGKIKDS
jgi:hypothetical protein